MLSSLFLFMLFLRFLFTVHVLLIITDLVIIFTRALYNLTNSFLACFLCFFDDSKASTFSVNLVTDFTRTDTKVIISLLSSDDLEVVGGITRAVGGFDFGFGNDENVEATSVSVSSDSTSESEHYSKLSLFSC